MKQMKNCTAKSQINKLKKLFKPIGTLVILIGFGTSISGQNWNVYDSSNSALPENQIKVVKVDQAGNKWVGTKNHGLVRFDGSNWYFYDDSLSTDRVYSIAINESSGDKWFGTYDLDGLGSIYKFDGNSWDYHSPFNGLDYIVKSIAFDQSDDVWVGSGYDGLAMYDGNDWYFYNENNSEIPDNSIEDIAVDKSDNLWIGFDLRRLEEKASLAKYNGSKWVIFEKSSSGLPVKDVNSIAIDESDNKWLGTDEGLVEYDGNSWTLYNKSNSGLPSNWIKALAIDGSENIWIGTDGGGLVKFDGNKWTVYDTSNSNIPGNKQISTIDLDRNGDIWIGYEGLTADWSHGLVKFMKPDNTSIRGKENKNSIKIYPNPAQNQLQLQTPTQAQTYTLHTLTGQKAQSGKLTGKGTHALDVSNLSSGVYLLEVRGEEAVRTKKVVVK